MAFRMLNLASYFAIAAGACAVMRPPHLIVAATDPPVLGMLGAWLKRRWNCGLVYNVRDLYPDIAEVNGMTSRSCLRLLAHANAQAFAAADRIIAVGHDMRERIIAKGVPRERISVIPDWADCRAIRPLERNRLRESFGGKFVVMYSGNLGLSQQLETVLEAASRLREDRRILFVLIGDGANKASLMRQAAARGLGNLRFMPCQPRERLAESLGAAGLHLIPLKGGAAGCVVPSKVYGIMAAARPFIAMMEPAAEVARLAFRYGIGEVIPPGDHLALAAAVAELTKNPERLNAMGRKARHVALSHFERRVITRRFGEELTNISCVREQLSIENAEEFRKIPKIA
jgi:putative colanic acid biosynthesis glycosyltransferase WcaI